MVLDQLMRMEKELNTDRQSMQQSIDAKQRLIEQQVNYNSCFIVLTTVLVNAYTAAGG